MTQAIIQNKREAIKKARQRAADIRYKAMRDQYANPCCHACGFRYPPIVHLHHVKPLGETGKDSNDLVWLCPNCHAMVHEIRRCYFSKRRVSNLEMRLSHLDYWLDSECPKDVSQKLLDIARRS